MGFRGTPLHTQRRASHSQHLHSVQGEGPLLGLLFPACGLHLEDRTDSGIQDSRGKDAIIENQDMWAKGLVSFIWSPCFSISFFTVVLRFEYLFRARKGKRKKNPFLENS